MSIDNRSKFENLVRILIYYALILIWLIRQIINMMHMFMHIRHKEISQIR